MEHIEGNWGTVAIRGATLWVPKMSSGFAHQGVLVFSCTNNNVENREQ